MKKVAFEGQAMDQGPWPISIYPAASTFYDLDVEDIPQRLALFIVHTVT